MTQRNLGEAILVLIGLGIERQQRDEALDETTPDTDDRAVRRAIHDVLDPDSVLADIVTNLLHLRDERNEHVRRVRGAHALAEVAGVTRAMREEWNKEQSKKGKDGLVRRGLGESGIQRRRLAERVRHIFTWWEIEVSDTKIAEIVDAALARPLRDKGLEQRLATVLSPRVIPAGARTIEGILASLRGRTQSQGRIRRSEEARRLLYDEPVWPREALAYVLRLLTNGLPERAVDKVLKAWQKELQPPSGAVAGARSEPPKKSRGRTPQGRSQ